MTFFSVQYQDGEAAIEFIPTPNTRAAVEKSLDILGGRAADYGLTFDPSSSVFSFWASPGSKRILSPR